MERVDPLPWLHSVDCSPRSGAATPAMTPARCCPPARLGTLICCIRRSRRASRRPCGGGRQPWEQSARYRRFRISASRSWRRSSASWKWRTGARTASFSPRAVKLAPPWMGSPTCRRGGRRRIADGGTEALPGSWHTASDTKGAMRENRRSSLRGSPRPEDTVKAQPPGTTNRPRVGRDKTRGFLPRTCRVTSCSTSGWQSARTKRRERTTASGRRFWPPSSRCPSHPDTCPQDRHITFSTIRRVCTPNSMSCRPFAATPRSSLRRRLPQLPGAGPGPFSFRVNLAVCMRAKLRMGPTREMFRPRSLRLCARGHTCKWVMQAEITRPGWHVLV